jgi:hypothetical protein
MLLPEMLLLSQQLIKMGLLLWGQDLAKLRPRTLQLLMQLRIHRFHHLASAFLALLENFVDALTLLGGKVQLALDSSEKLQPHATWRPSLAWVP